MARTNGKMVLYSYQPSFRSVLHGTGLVLQGFGEVNSSLQTVGVWFARPDDSSLIPSSSLTTTSIASPLNQNLSHQKYNRGIVYYLRNNRVVGILLCNAPETQDQAREIIREQKLLNNPSTDLKHRILLAPEHWLNVIVTQPPQ